MDRLVGECGLFVGHSSPNAGAASLHSETHPQLTGSDFPSSVAIPLDQQGRVLLKAREHPSAVVVGLRPSSHGGTINHQTTDAIILGGESSIYRKSTHFPPSVYEGPVAVLHRIVLHKPQKPSERTRSGASVLTRAGLNPCEGTV